LVGGKVDHRLTSLVHDRLRDKDADQRLAASRVELDDEVLLGPAVVPALQDLGLAGMEVVDALRFGESVEKCPAGASA
jgi:hypothetical protein